MLPAESLERFDRLTQETALKLRELGDLETVIENRWGSASG